MRCSLTCCRCGLAAHPDFMREGLLKMHIDCVRKLIEHSEKQIFGDMGHPDSLPKGRRQ